ncbi:SNP47 protein, partial [Brachypodius atriceps]|nr:SNP47 protein [Brachypodius atriceps]
MSEDAGIHSWPCSYYQESSRRWIPGRLSLSPLSVRFTSDKPRRILLDSRLSGIQEIKKESSQLIFSSLTLLESGTKHWFSSLQPSRNAVYNVLEHFWREQLLPGRAPAAGKGRELTGMLEGSQKSLEDTAKVLHSQGEQFDNIMRGLHKIEGDMDVADRYGMGAGNALEGMELPAGDLQEMKLWSFEGWSSSTRRGVNQPHDRFGSIWQAGGLEFQNSQGFRVFSSWEFRNSRCFRVFSIWQAGGRLGIPEFLSFPGVFCLAGRWVVGNSGIPKVFRVFSMEFFGGRSAPQSDLRASVWQAASGFLGAAADPGIPAGSSEGPREEQLQLQKISQEEAEELRQILRKLKGLALETEAELERQDEALECIGGSVERATLSIERQNRRIRRLT